MKGKEEHSIGVIKVNPEQNKHLETVSMRLDDVWVDFVNLRPINYTSSEKVLEIGTPYQDALQRDLTINSLFYNINTDTVEDWCGTGLDDLVNKSIQTPIPSMQTFRDDPLRVLRVIRFATRLKFKLAPSIVEASQNPEIQEKLSKCISRERIGKEIAGILDCDHPEIALKCISDFGLTGAVFQYPPSVEMKEIYKQKCMQYTNHMVQLLSHVDVCLPPDQIKMLILTSYLIPFSDDVYVVKKKVFPVPSYIFMESLKFTKIETKIAMTLLDTFRKWRPIINQSRTNQSIERKGAGLVMRETKDLWLASMSMELLEEMIHNTELSLVIKIWTQLKNQIEEHKLIGVWDLKPYFDGRQIMEMLCLKAGANIGKIINEQICWQLQNPHATIEECESWLKWLKHEKFE